MKDLTLRELQTQLPWTVHYHHDFRASPMSHKDFGHALLHVTKACGKLAAVVNDAEHASWPISLSVRCGWRTPVPGERLIFREL